MTDQPSDRAALDRLLYGEATDSDLDQLNAALDDQARCEAILNCVAIDAHLRALGHDADSFLDLVRERLTRSTDSAQFTGAAIAAIGRNKQRGIRLRWILGALCATAVGLLTVALLLPEQHVTPSSPRSVDIAIAEQPHQGITPEGHTTLRYADGTELVIEANSQWQLGTNTQPGKHLALLSGTVRATVAPQPEAEPFVISHDQGTVTVVGTELTVSAGRHSVAVQVRTGRVRLSRHRKHGSENTDVSHGEMAVAELGRPLHRSPDTHWDTVTAAVTQDKPVDVALSQLAPHDPSMHLALDQAPASGRDIIGIDWATVPPYRKRMHHPDLDMDLEQGQQPIGWSSNIWDLNSVGEVAIEDAPGLAQRAWVIRNIEGRAAAQMMLWRPYAIQPTSRYELSFRYHSAHPQSALRLRLKLDDDERLARVLPAATTNWRRVTITFDTKAARHLSWNFQNNTVGADRALFITNISLVRLGPSAE
ncbi:MAG: FecR domain-containing protein [Planctomycetota bacterium]|jgi:ferric-dicitrate binding protein FerR (iron transport regulator)|nr:FecR domain-containing protein [Planctomycetota bacterium]